MGKKKEFREPRKDLINTVNLLRPLDMNLIGSDNDPCFGKLYDPKAPECKKCGDFEVCAMVFGQNNHKLRAIEEKKGNFLDMEEEAIDKLTPLQNGRKLIRRIVTTNKSISVTQLEIEVCAGLELSKADFKKCLNKVLNGSDKFELKNNKLILKS